MSNDCRLRSFSCFLLPWQEKQFCSRKGLTTVSNPALDRADGGAAFGAGPDAFWAEPTITIDESRGRTRSDRTHLQRTVTPLRPPRGSKPLPYYELSGIGQTKIKLIPDLRHTVRKTPEPSLITVV